MQVRYATVLLLLLTASCGCVTPEPPGAGSQTVPAQQGAPQAAPELAPSPAKAPATAPALDLDALEQQLRATKAIGFFTKVTLKNQVDDLVDQFRDFHKGKAKRTKAELRRSYDLLMMKVLSLLQDGDRALASNIVSSREAIWAVLEDPKAFATL
jgi:hypothetical protein